MKLSINKLIANDIINYGMDQASETNYIVSLDTYLQDFDEESQKYILENIDEITNDIEASESIADLVVEETENGKDFNMIFYWGSLLTQVEKIVFDNAKQFGRDLDLGDVRDIAKDLLDDDAFNDDLINKINSYDNGRNID